MKIGKAFLTIIAGLSIIFITCDVGMGMGNPVDLEPPVLELVDIYLPNDIPPVPIADVGDRIIVGPSVVFGPGALIRGIVTDNSMVIEVQAVELINGIPSGPTWSTNTDGKLSERDKRTGVQNWEIALSNLSKGEKVIQFTAIDGAIPPNIGSRTVKEISLLVDTDPPLVEKINIERYPGILPDLLPRRILEEFDRYNFDHIDYFQNERFTIKANIFHEYEIVEVWLALIAENGDRVIDKKVRNIDSSLLAPVWDVTAGELGAYRNVNQYFKVEVSAIAKAGHSNEFIENTLYNLYWCPDADYPFFELGADDIDAAGIIYAEAASAFPVIIFDDDNIDSIRWAVISDVDWASISGADDISKVNTLLQNPGHVRSEGGFDIIINPVSDARNHTIDIQVPSVNGNYKLVVYAKDKNYNGTAKSPALETKTVYNLTVSNERPPPCELIQIVCLSGNGPHKGGDTLEFSLIFNGRVYTVGNAYIEVRGLGPWSATSSTNRSPTDAPVRINMEQVTQANADFVLTGKWENIIPGYVYNTVQITDIVMSGIRRGDNRDDIRPIPDNRGTISNLFNTRNNIVVMSVAPTIVKINDEDVTGTSTEALPVSTYTNDYLKLEFSHDVTAGQGLITIKPDGDWHIPPVLTNDQYIEIRNALTSETDRSNLINPTLESYYIRTTHGLRKNGGVQTGTPDTSTKYVLNFASDITGGSGTSVDNLRQILNRAKFNWQEIAVSPMAVKTNNPNGLININNNEVTIDLNKLPDGRKWKVEIRGPGTTNAGAFTDIAGNTFAGWPSAGGADNNRTFWSQNVAEPVIRVDRVSNNNAETAPLQITSFETIPSVNRTNTRYRIDCETPGAVITYNTDTLRVANIFGSTDAVSFTGTLINDNAFNRDRFRSRDIDGVQNSSLIDPTNLSINLTGTVAGSRVNPPVKALIGDASLFTARKDYIAAQAYRDGFEQSNIGYEGAFKTTILYAFFDAIVEKRRGDTTGVTEASRPNRRLKIEGTDQRMGGVKTAGFPLNIHSIPASGSRFFYRYGSISRTGTTDSFVSTTTNNTGYWIWISWEMVCDFWTLNPTTNENGDLYKWQQTTPANYNDSWNSDSESWAVWTYRKYGNWGLRVNHRNGGNYNTTTGAWTGGTYNGRQTGN